VSDRPRAKITQTTRARMMPNGILIQKRRSSKPRATRAKRIPVAIEKPTKRTVRSWMRRPATIHSTGRSS
jgi:hypothetical protein